jgi:hypothetical protein
MSKGRKEGADRESITVDWGSVTVDRGNITVDRGTVTVYRENITVYRETVTVDRESVTVGGESVTVDRGNVTVDRGNIPVDRENVLVYRGSVTVYRESVTVYRETEKNRGQGAMSKLRMLRDSQGNAKSGVYLLHFDRRDGADIISQQGLTDTNQFITINGALVLQPLFHAHLNLGGKTIASGINRGADNRGEAGINKQLPAYHQKNAMLFGVILRAAVYPEQVAPLHWSKSWYASTSSASALSRSALRLRYASSSASVILGRAGAGETVSRVVTRSRSSRSMSRRRVRTPEFFTSIVSVMGKP